jgi:hypothetical protein
MVEQLARETGGYLVLKYQPGGGDIPGGLVGKALRDADEAERRRIVRDALSKLRELQKKQGARAHSRNSEPSPVPPRRVIDNLLAASASGDFESARCEWEYHGEIVYEGEAHFARECELCGPKEFMQTNYVIRNAKTGTSLRVGSVCIKRFLVLRGTTSEVESAALFDHKTRLAAMGRSLGVYIADLGMEAIPEKAIIAVFGALEKAFPHGLSSDDAEVIIQAAGAMGRPADIFRAIATKDPKGLRGLKIKKMSNREERRRKAGRVLSTLSRSAAYRDPGSD